ncbi:MAG TPA: DUF4112 domain-containing protein [Saprospiraceae bacterium]|nr:DUF4112 domain-containing protein [Saprospiraceae bacterium]HMP22754.1 DUF4112 domain-containing protein [Saprospiraceae bacterium]
MRKKKEAALIVLTAQQERNLFWLDRTADWLDNRFRIPGTKVRFGLDAVVGVVPYAGDVAGFVVSGFLVVVMARSGASGMVGLKMAGNILLDAVVGIFPILGDWFDLRYKANTRNVRLLQQHYREGRHRGSGRWAVLLILLALAGSLWLMVFVVAQVVGWLWQQLVAAF